MRLLHGAQLARRARHAKPATATTTSHVASRPLAPVANWPSRLRLPQRSAALAARRSQPERRLFTSRNQQGTGKGPRKVVAPALAVIGGLLVYSFYPGPEERQDKFHRATKDRRPLQPGPDPGSDEDPAGQAAGKTAWGSFVNKLTAVSNITDIEWSGLSERLVDLILPEWSKGLPGNFQKLQRELSSAPGSLAEEIWDEAHDPFINPEIRYSAKVRVSDDLCDDEKEFLARRKKVATAALARYLGLDEKDIHPDDVPTIAVCGSGGGLRAMVAGTGSLLATQEDGLFDCITYTSGVSGTCWLQALYHSSIGKQDFKTVIDQLKARIGVHIAYPPAVFDSVLSAPTNKLLLSSMVEKLRGDPNAAFGLVDIYGILLAARLLVPKGELGVNDRDFKLSNQREYIKFGQNPMPIYTAVRHEIPDLEGTPPADSDAAKERAKQEAWFQWFEMTPYEFFCEEFNAGIPIWAIGRRFDNGKDVAPESGFHLPELRMPILMGIFGSAFCATLSHYYREVRPLVRSLTGFGTIDEMIHGHNDNLEKVHPIDPAQIPNFVHGMPKDKLRFTTPTNIQKQEHIQLMDAGMSNNLPIYPLLRPGRDVDIIIAFDASADIKTDNWLSVADGYARQRGVKGWPVGVGWPRAEEAPLKAEAELDSAMPSSSAEAEQRLAEAQRAQGPSHGPDPADQKAKAAQDQSEGTASSELGYCTIWVGSTEERSSAPPPPSKALRSTDADDAEGGWHLRRPDAGLAVVYLPFMANPKVAGVDPARSDYMSTWNFVYTPDQVDRVVALARANYAEGRDQIRGCVRAVYERRRKLREERDAARRDDRRRRLTRLGLHGRLGEGDHFS